MSQHCCHTSHAWQHMSLSAYSFEATSWLSDIMEFSYCIQCLFPSNLPLLNITWDVLYISWNGQITNKKDMDNSTKVIWHFCLLAITFYCFRVVTSPKMDKWLNLFHERHTKEIWNSPSSELIHTRLKTKREIWNVY